MQKRILITGGAGFVGSSLAVGMKRKYPSYDIFCLDNLKRRGSELNISRLKQEGIQFIHGDIRNREDLEQVNDRITTIIEASAEPSVLAGLNSSPDYLLNTNLGGTINCLHLAAKHKADFIFLSTSRVYPIETIEQINFSEGQTRFSISDAQTIEGVSSNGIGEAFPLTGFRSLYGASKLCSEYLIQEFNQFFNLKTVINRCGVLTGPWQMGKVDQGVMVLWVARHYWRKPLSYIGYGGKGKQVRDVLDVDDLFELIDLQIHGMEKVNGKILNVGGGIESSVSLCELTALCEKVTGNRIEIAQVKENRQADIRIYITDNRTVTGLTGWRPSMSMEKIVERIYNWIKANESALLPILGA